MLDLDIDIDMAEVATAFARKFPQSAKARTRDATGVLNALDPDFMNDLLFERQKDAGTLFVISVPAFEPGMRIWDHYNMNSDHIGVHCTQNNISGADGSTTSNYWSPDIMFTPRRITPKMWGLRFDASMTQDRSSDDNPCAPSPIASPAILGNQLVQFGVDDFGGGVGVRWYVAVATDTIQNPLFVRETNYLDLGPGVNMYSPTYGLLRYRHDHPDGKWREQSYGAVVPFEDHANFLNCNHIVY